MTVRPIRLFGDPVLRSPADPIAPAALGSSGVRDLVQDLIDTVKEPGRAGVAAPQIGVGLRAFSYNVDGEVGYVLNPEVVEVSGSPSSWRKGACPFPGSATRPGGTRTPRSVASTSTAPRWCSRAPG
ncbi:peptide deformylase [Sphingomonas sp. LR61]